MKTKEADADATEQLGIRVAEFRQLRGLSLRQLAASAGVSISFLSQLENGRTNASIATLRKLATALGITPVHLLESRSTHTAGVLKASDRPTIELDGATKYVLSTPPVRSLEVYAGHFSPGSSTGPEAYIHGDAQEMFIVIRGRVVLQLGDNEYTLSEGDSIEYRSSVPHRVYNPFKQKAEVLWINTPPTSEAVAVSNGASSLHP